MSIKIGRAADVREGELRAFDAQGTAICVTSVAGRLLAVDDTCTHAGCSLADGELDGTTITCPCHGSRFDVTTGAVLRGPAERPVRAWVVRQEGEALVAET